MKNLLLILSFLIFTYCSEPITIVNSSGYEYINKNVVLHASDLAIDKGMFPAIYNEQGALIPSQVDDTDGDGIWDEVAFQVSIPKNQKMNFRVKAITPNNYPSFDPKTQIHLGYSANRNDQFTAVKENIRPEDHVAQSTPYLYQYEGPGWESNLVAFRSYFDSRNGKDIFGKRTEELVTDQIGTGEDYHSLQPWGMDILKVGNSLGAGALAIKRGKELIRLGDTEIAEFKVLYEGPVRSSFQLIYKGWDVVGESYELSEQITIWANKRWYRSTVTLNPTVHDTLVTGIVNLHDMEVHTGETSEFHFIYTHGLQSENQDHLGMAVLVPVENFIEFGKAPNTGTGITNTELAYMQAKNNSCTFYFYTGWEGENPEFSSLEFFNSELEQIARQFQTNF